eukprot:402674-Hanusia_phi.AAC.3
MDGRAAPGDRGSVLMGSKPFGSVKIRSSFLGRGLTVPGAVPLNLSAYQPRPGRRARGRARPGPLRPSRLRLVTSRLSYRTVTDPELNAAPPGPGVRHPGARAAAFRNVTLRQFVSFSTSCRCPGVPRTLAVIGPITQSETALDLIMNKKLPMILLPCRSRPTGDSGDGSFNRDRTEFLSSAYHGIRTEPGVNFRPGSELGNFRDL